MTINGLVFFCVSLLFAGGCSWFVCRKLIYKAEHIGLIDIPNERSSHDRPVPRGGGIGIVAAMLVVLLALYSCGVLDISALKMCGVWLAVAAMALVGFADDRFNLSAFPRFVCQTVIAACIIWIVGVPSFFVFPFLKITILAAGLSALWLVAHTNFFNFMDGIDGLAGMQAFIAGIFAGIYGWLVGDGVIVVMGTVMSSAVAGFLVFNYPPAKIFMGDVGSGTLGFYIALLCVIQPAIWVPMIFVMGTFIYDTIVTLARRVMRGEKWYEAHRSHLYQRAVICGYSHRRVTVIMGVVAVLMGMMGVGYLRSSFVWQVAIIVVAVGLLSVLAGLVCWKERVTGK
jgi:Fuc2NAc and GlcNAc transferase